MTMYAFVQGMGDEPILADDKALESFLANVQRRAFLMARAALGNSEDALDAVQDAMLMLVRKYRRKPEAEWRLLFFRILNNRIRDLIRRRAVRNRFGGWLRINGRDGGENDDDYDPFQHVADAAANDPRRDLERHQSMAALEQALGALPRRQQEAFMLRCWEGMSTAETAAVMSCSEGSVKTHYFRALKTLQTALEEHRDE